MQPRIQFQIGIPAIINQPTTWNAPTFFNAPTTFNTAPSIKTKGNLTAYTNAAPATGDFWFDTTQKTLMTDEAGLPVYKGSVVSAIKTTFYQVYLTVATTYYNILPAANMLNTLTFPANFMIVGKTVRVKLKGIVYINAGTTTLRMRINFLGQSGTYCGCSALASGFYNFEAEFEISCNQTGSALSGQANETAKMTLFYGTAGVSYSVLNYGAVAISTDVASTLAIEATDLSNANSYVEVFNATVEVLG